MLERIQASSFLNKGDKTLAGFVLAGRWPDTTHEWAQFLALAVRLAAGPGLLPHTRIFQAVEKLPDDPAPGTVGLVTTLGSFSGPNPLVPGCLADHPPRALVVLHPPDETQPSLPEATGAASGCVLLPGLPHLGLEHRASWVEAQADGTVTRLISAVGPDAGTDPDLAVLSLLFAA